MKRQALYQKTVDILVQAYFNDTLEHGNCYACAVGNLIAGNRGFGFIKSPYGVHQEHIFTGEGFLYWDRENLFSSNPVKTLWRGVFRPEDFNDSMNKNVRATGYSLEELAQIEYHFERVGGADDEKMFNGLMSVIDCLDEIHENKDEVATTKTKQRFLPAKC